MIETVPEIDSTNAELQRRLRAGLAVPEGHWLVADRQSGGRGRLERAWESPEGNFSGSTVLIPLPGDPPVTGLSFAAALAVYEAVAAFVLDRSELMLKWPNDLLLRGGKLAGILLEGEGKAVVVGIGVNLREAPKIAGRKTSALADCGAPPARDIFANELARHWTMEVERWRQFGMPALLKRWAAAAHPEGTALTVREPRGGVLHGRYAGIEADGALRLRLADGTCRAIHAADVET